MSNVINLAEHQQAVWLAYVTAANRAQETGRDQDAEIAREKWAAWLTLFVRPESKAVSMDLARGIAT